MNTSPRAVAYLLGLGAGGWKRGEALFMNTKCFERTKGGVSGD